jgi:hypothetical protein
LRSLLGSSFDDINLRLEEIRFVLRHVNLDSTTFLCQLFGCCDSFVLVGLCFLLGFFERRSQFHFDLLLDVASHNVTDNVVCTEKLFSLLLSRLITRRLHLGSSTVRSRRNAISRRRCHRRIRSAWLSLHLLKLLLMLRSHFRNLSRILLFMFVQPVLKLILHVICPLLQLLILLGLAFGQLSFKVYSKLGDTLFDLLGRCGIKLYFGHRRHGWVSLQALNFLLSGCKVHLETLEFFRRCGGWLCGGCSIQLRGGNLSVRGCKALFKARLVKC